MGEGNAGGQTDPERDAHTHTPRARPISLTRHTVHSPQPHTHLLIDAQVLSRLDDRHDGDLLAVSSSYFSSRIDRSPLACVVCARAAAALFVGVLWLCCCSPPLERSIDRLLLLPPPIGDDPHPLLQASEPRNPSPATAHRPVSVLAMRMWCRGEGGGSVVRVGLFLFSQFQAWIVVSVSATHRPTRPCPLIFFMTQVQGSSHAHTH
jgi:hypothetical protein